MDTKLEIVVPPKNKMNNGLDGEMTKQVTRVHDPANDRSIINRLTVLCKKFDDLPALDEIEAREELEKYDPFLDELGFLAHTLLETYEECGLIWDEKRKEIAGSWS